MTVIGSGLSGLAFAQQLNMAGHTITPFKRVPKVGGLLRYGIPDFKLEFELMPTPGLDRPASQPWPNWPVRLRTSSSHEEGETRHWNILTKRFIGGNGRIHSLETVNVSWTEENGRPVSFEEIPGSEKIWPADLVLLSMGFTGPETDTVVAALGLDVSPQGTIQADGHMTSRSGVFAAGDGRRGQSPIVWAISEGREAARKMDLYLMGRSEPAEKQ